MKQGEEKVYIKIIDKVIFSLFLANKRICSVKFCKGCKGMLQKSLYGISKLGCQQLVYAKIIFMFTKFCAPLYCM